MAGFGFRNYGTQIKVQSLCDSDAVQKGRLSLTRLYQANPRSMKASLCCEALLRHVEHCPPRTEFMDNGIHNLFRQPAVMRLGCNQRDFLVHRLASIGHDIFKP